MKVERGNEGPGENRGWKVAIAVSMMDEFRDEKS